MATDKKKPLDQLNAALGSFNQAGQRADALQERARQIQIPAPIIREGRGTVTSRPMPGTNAAVLANQTLGARVNAERATQQSLAPRLDSLAEQVRQQTAQARAQSTQQGANALLAGVGADAIPDVPRPTPRPNFNNVVGTAATVPARNPVSPGASAGATAPAGGVPASVPAAAPAALKPGDVNTFTGVNGVTRPVPGMQAQATGGVQAQSFGGLSMPTLAAPVAAPAASAAPRQDMGVAIPRPVRADAFNVRQANERNDKIADTIESELFRNSFAAGRGSRSARQAQADMLQTLAQLGGKQLDVAANVAGGDRDASVKGDLAGMEQSGANQRAVLGDTGDTTRTGMQEAGATQRVQLQSLADLNKPTQVTDASGNLLSVTGTTATPVVGADGKPVRSAQTKADGAVTPQVALDSATEELKALLSNPPLQADPNYDARVSALSQQVQALRTGNSTAAGAPSGMTLVGTTKDGKKVYRDANGKTFSE